MSPNTGKLRIRRDLRRLGLGWLQISAHTRNKRVFEQRSAVVTKLIDDGQVAVLKALKDGRVTLEQLVELDRAQQMTGSNVLGEVAMRAPLFAKWDELAPAMGTSVEGRKRYAVTKAQLKDIAKWPDTMTVKDLVTVDWVALAASWPNSASDWNHVRRAISHFLSVLLNDKYHPIRRQIVAKIPAKKENERVPDVTPAVFYRILEHVREDLKPVFVTLAATGLRVRSEFLRMTDAHVLPATHQLKVPREGKTGERMVAVDPELWPWIRAAIPSPVQYKQLRTHWQRACAAADVSGVVLHDLRHCHAQWATDQGAALTQVQVQLGHTTTAMTGRYAKRREARAAASAVGRAMKRQA